MEEQRWQLSLLERLHAIAGMEPIMLETQYRMVEAIASWPSATFYQNRLLTATVLQGKIEGVRGFPWPEQSPLAFVHINAQERKPDASNTYVTRCAILSGQYDASTGSF